MGSPIRSLNMATTTTLRPEPSGPTELPHTQSQSARDLDIYVAGRPSEERVLDLLAFALATEAGHPTTPDGIERSRQAAAAALSDHAFRYLHNSIDRIRREAAAEQLAKLSRPPGFGTILLANLVALALAGGLAAWLALHPATLAGLAGLPRRLTHVLCTDCRAFRRL
ncbi:hypothetical protein [Dankookia sp. P2]|uniref:hypothetical protein n=1 Tax=Dankookia sp. P2 TaxID=3423955 RepID=UPI003D679F84